MSLKLEKSSSYDLVNFDRKMDMLRQLELSITPEVSLHNLEIQLGHNSRRTEFKLRQPIDLNIIQRSRHHLKLAYMSFVYVWNEFYLNLPELQSLNLVSIELKNMCFLLPKLKKLRIDEVYSIAILQNLKISEDLESL